MVEKQYQFFINLQKCLPGSLLFARNDMSKGIVGAELILTRNKVYHIEIEDKVCLDVENPYIVVEEYDDDGYDDIHIVHDIESVKKIIYSD